MTVVTNVAPVGTDVRAQHRRAVGVVVGVLALAALGGALHVPASGTAPAAWVALDGPLAGAALDVNTASERALARIAGIGRARARAIVAARSKEPFTSVDDLARVKGIGPAKLDLLRRSVTVR